MLTFQIFLIKPVWRVAVLIAFFFADVGLAQAQPAEGNWFITHFSGTTPEKRHESAFARVGDQFYLLGGRGSKTIQVYDPITRKWSNTRTSTQDIHHFQAVTYKEKIYIIGALTGRFPDEDPLSHILVYDPAADLLDTAAAIPQNRQRGSSGVVVYEDRFYLIAGNRNGHSAFMEDGKTAANVPWFDVYDPATDSWKSLPDAPHARDHFAAAVINGKLYIAGGRRSRQGATEGTFRDTEAAVDVYDFSSEQWLSPEESPDSIPTPRAGAAVAVLQGELMVIGGEVENYPPDNLALPTTEVLNLANGSWRTLTDVHTGRHGSQALVYQDTVFLPAGSKTRGATEITADENFMEAFSFDSPAEEKPEPDTSGWTAVRHAHNTRTESPCVLYEGELYFFNGFSSDILIEASCEKYNPQTNTWTKLASMPAQNDSLSWAVTHNGIALVEDTVWIVGGRIGNHPGPVTSKVWWYKISTDTWMPGPDLPAPAGGGGLGRLGRKLHYVGGFDAEARCDAATHFVYDLDHPEAGWQDLTDTAPMPEPRNHFGTVVLGGKLYTIGGQHGHDGCQEGEDVASVHVYDPVIQQWKKLADFPHPESHMEPGSFALDGKIYVVGGEVEGDQVHVYDPASDQWTDFARLPEKLMATGARMLGDTLLLAFGGIPDVHNPTDKAYIRTFPRTPLQQLGFNPSELAVNLEADTVRQVEIILFNHAGKTTYTIDDIDFPSWLSVSKTKGKAQESDEEIILSLDAGGMAAGAYQYQLKATAPDYTEALLNITLTVARQEEPVLSADDHLPPQQLLLYPNPALHQAMLSADMLQAGHPFQVEVLDAMGKVWRSYRWHHRQSSQSYMLPTDDLPAGVYTVQLTQGKTRQQQRLLKQ